MTSTPPTTPPLSTPPPPQRDVPPPQRDVETWLSRVLAVGVLFAAFIIVFGGVLFLRAHTGERVDLGTFTPQPPRLTSPAAIFHDALRLNPAAVMQMGLLLLVLTPVLRVIASLLLFALKRDMLYTIISLLVLGALLLGLFGGMK